MAKTKDIVTFDKPDGSTIDEFVSIVLKNDFIIPSWAKNNIVSILNTLPGVLEHEVKDEDQIFDITSKIKINDQDFEVKFKMVIRITAYSALPEERVTFTAYFYEMTRLNHPEPLWDNVYNVSGEKAKVTVYLNGETYIKHPGDDKMQIFLKETLNELPSHFNRTQGIIKGRNTKRMKEDSVNNALTDLMNSMGLNDGVENLEKIFDICDDHTVPLLDRRQKVVNTIADMIKNLKK